MSPQIIHLVTAPPDPMTRAMIGGLVAGATEARHVILDLGSSPWRHGPLVVHRRPAVAPLTPLFRRRVVEFLREFASTGPIVIHAWDLPAANVAARLNSRRLCGIVVENAALAARLPAAVRRIARHTVGKPTALRWVARSTFERSRLLSAGVAPERCELTPALVPDDADTPAALPPEWRGRFSPRTVLVLPPILRGSGAFHAVWGGLLAHQVYADLRLVVPGDGPEVARIRRLASAADMPEAVVFTGNALPLATLVRHVRAAALLPTELVSADALRWAFASRTPVLACNHPAVAALVGGDLGRSLQVVPARQPDAIAAGMLALLEKADRATALAAAALRAYEQSGTASQVLSQYRRLYAHLLEAAKS